jgi:ketosteroid isomerase-like protein
MCDVPPSFESKSIEAYRKTWNLFYSAQPEPIAFDMQRMDVVAGVDVAFGHCSHAMSGKGEKPRNDRNWIFG